VRAPNTAGRASIGLTTRRTAERLSGYEPIAAGAHVHCGSGNRSSCRDCLRGAHSRQCRISPTVDSAIRPWPTNDARHRGGLFSVGQRVARSLPERWPASLPREKSLAVQGHCLALDGGSDQAAPFNERKTRAALRKSRFHQPAGVWLRSAWREKWSANKDRFSASARFKSSGAAPREIPR